MFAPHVLRMSRFGGTLAGVIAVVALVALPSATAAHDESIAMAASEALHLRLVRAVPAVDSTFVGSPATISLWFSEPVQAKLTSVKVTNGSGEAVALGPLSRDTAEKAPVVAKVMKPMAPGRYTVAWRTMGKDGHVVKNTYSFMIAAASAGAGR